MNMVKGFSGVMGIKRVAGISRVLVRHGLGNVSDWISGFWTGRTKQLVAIEGRPATGFLSPERIRRTFEELGPSFIKLGQLMSTRADIFPASYIEELRKLQDQVPAIPFSEIQQVIEEELKKPIGGIFRECRPESIAAASVSQVHAAILFTGEKVAVKVIRPGIRKIIEQDIRLMYYLAGIIENNFELGKVVGATNLVKEFERTIFNELDMFIEAGNIDRFAKNFQGSDEIHIPDVYWDLTSKSVLVMEYIEGIKMDEVDALRAGGLDPEKIALIGLRSFSRQLMEFGFFHADPHPANTIVMANGSVGIVDFGIMGYLDDEMMQHVAHLLLGFAEHDYDMVMEALEDAGILREDMPNLLDFKTDLKDVSELFYGRPLKTISVRDVYDQVMKLVLKYHIKLPRNLLLLFKTFIQTEALGKILQSSASLLEVSRPFAKKFLEKRYAPENLFSEMTKDIKDMGSHLKMAPKWLHDILKQTAAGKQRLELHHSGFSSMDARIEKGINRLTIGIIIAASTIAASLILNSSQKVLEFSFNLFGRQTLTITGILGLTGYTVATILGIWLIYSIFRSGKM
jgi:ubiquinone biosynthesis protein